MIATHDSGKRYGTHRKIMRCRLGCQTYPDTRLSAKSIGILSNSTHIKYVVVAIYIRIGLSVCTFFGNFGGPKMDQRKCSNRYLCISVHSWSWIRWIERTISGVWCHITLHMAVTTFAYSNRYIIYYYCVSLRMHDLPGASVYCSQPGRKYKEHRAWILGNW